MAAVVLSALCAFTVYVLLHVFWFHFFDVHARAKVMTLIMFFSGCFLPAWIHFWKGHAPDWSHAIWVAPLSAGLFFTLIWFGYLLFYSAFDTSPSLRFLVEMLSKGSVTPDELKVDYDFEDVFRRRVERAVATGYLVKSEQNGQVVYANTVRAQRIGSVSSYIKDFLRLGKGG
ncbi:MAG: hypothetical protein JST16_00545 [Bdellovibrionales bacterium]|nr:hypothetical protein [Bdellovibrionales bacterium]